MQKQISSLAKMNLIGGACGGLLIRGLNLDDSSLLEETIAATDLGEWVPYREAATPRSAVTANIGTSTEYSASNSIFFHNENSHCMGWPGYLAFYCLVPAQSGGATPLSCIKSVTAEIPQTLKDKFAEVGGFKYVRNFGGPLGFKWQKVFQTDDRHEIEQYCQENKMEFQWNGTDRLTISYVRPATVNHPLSQEPLWFNHGTFFNRSAVDKPLKPIMDMLPATEIPYHTFFADGSDISRNCIEDLMNIYEKHSLRFEWKKGDLLLFDNMLLAHGRDPFLGDRQLFVGMVKNIRR
jgi:hypothetical protein